MRFTKRLFLKILLAALGVWYLFFALPTNLFEVPTSTVLFDQNNQLLAAKIADDQQWRFPVVDSVPTKFKTCLLQFEDAYFNYHPGFNPISLVKALGANLKHQRIVRGGSTITMQTLRLARNQKKRTLYQKVMELVLATRLELTHSKKEILRLYCSHTPYGGNIVGLNAAAWRYYGRTPHQLSWAESATLAVLPNAPSLIYPGKNHIRLKQKRDKLLNKLLSKKIIDATTCWLAKREPIPNKPQKLPNQTQHLLQYAIKKGYKGKPVKTTLKKHIQAQTINIIEEHSKLLKSNHIYNAACLVLEIDTGNVLAYVGNSPQKNGTKGQNVDIIQASRSTGSVLKPFLYAASLQEGSILPHTLLPDIPTQIAGYTPKNYSLTYDGAVPASEALSRSLNIPAVHLLRQYRYERFHDLLKKLGITTLNKPSDYYGLSMILGGSEANLWELSGAYASLARNLKSSTIEGLKKMHLPHYDSENSKKITYASPLDNASIYLMLEALKKGKRPLQEAGWQYFNQPENIAWKTGTSFGNRDAWSIGMSHHFLVGVWVGNADGEGRAELTGIRCAAPIMFDVFKLFNTNSWYRLPEGQLVDTWTCAQSGYKASRLCKNKKPTLVGIKGQTSKSCPYHQLVHLSADKKFQVNSSCAKPFEMHHESWFVLPPIMEWYYQKKHSNYLTLPPLKTACFNTDTAVMEFIYPKQFSKLFIPKQLNGKLGKLIFKIAHRNPKTTLFWHVDNQFVGQTLNFHELALQPKIGKHMLTVVDSQGQRLEKSFEIIDEETSL